MIRLVVKINLTLRKTWGDIVSIRTDMAVELLEESEEKFPGVLSKEYISSGYKVTDVEIITDNAAEKIGKPKGRYITFESNNSFDISDSDELTDLLAENIGDLLEMHDNNFLVVGVGNISVTPDALGPKTAAGILATRHICDELAETIGLKGLRSVSVLSPGVLGQTGIELFEIVECAVKKTNSKKIIIIDALAARNVSRLGRTIQLSNTGLIPGSGVGNSRVELSESTLGVKCITIGVPTVVDAATLCYDMTGVSCSEHEHFIVTQRDIDKIIKNTASIISKAVNIALQPKIDKRLLLSCV